ncbi:carotenoid biosynthesis protein [Robertkochia aurantiaca]|uniref:carotenoid biosynthesis protein n=1 Tax=Robertkochia aurantiaca TaxID=2873700 RepID=UPI001CCF1CF0|nr:carotenoid biosynthesis protein [Robertkochia sp. 3YJGBD-33]
MNLNLFSTLHNNKLAISVFLIWLFHVSAIIGILSTPYMEWFVSQTPVNLGLATVLLFWCFPVKNKKEVLVFLFCFTLGMTAEILGVNLGWFFGSYAYGENLGPKILGVPWLIGLNWAILSFISGVMAQWLNKSTILKIITGGILMLILDLFLEGIAPVFDYWQFAGGEPPLKNYVAWLVLAIIMQSVYHIKNIRGNRTFSLNLYLAQLLFFVIFFAVYGL